MLDIQNCRECFLGHHIDQGVRCMACSSHLCLDCSIEQGLSFSDIFGGTIYVCKACIGEYKEKGMDWLREELYEEFEDNVFLEALRKFEPVKGRRRVRFYWKGNKNNLD